MTDQACPVCGEPLEEFLLEDGAFICSNTDCDNETLYDENGEEVEE